jgi:hypothetical protein
MQGLFETNFYRIINSFHKTSLETEPVYNVGIKHFAKSPPVSTKKQMSVRYYQHHLLSVSKKLTRVSQPITAPHSIFKVTILCRSKLHRFCYDRYLLYWPYYVG